MSKSIHFEFCDFANQDDCTALIHLLQVYISDPMGNAKHLTKIQQLHVLHGLETHPASYVLFSKVEQMYVGMVICFINFSTFQAKPYTNIHDVIVLPKYRNMGIGQKMIEKVIAIAQEKKQCKITLEVRTDNLYAQSLYKSFGFTKTYPEMLFWTLPLEL